MITDENFEAYFNDFIEGRMKKEDVTEFQKFLDLNTHSQEEKWKFQNLKLKPSSIEFPFKNSLKKFQFDTTTIDENNFNDFCIAGHEKILSDQKWNELIAYVDHHPNKYNDFDLYKKSIVHPNLEITIDKTTLYKKEKGKKGIAILLSKYSALAASVALIVGVCIPIYRSTLNSVKLPVKIESNPAMAKTKPFVSGKIITGIDKRITPIIQSNKPGKLDDLLSVTPSERNKDEIPAYLQSIPLTRLKTDLEIGFEDKTKNINDQLGIASLSFKEFAMKRDKIENEENNLSLFNLAKLGIQTINKYTHSNMRLDRTLDESGNTTSMLFESKMIKFYQSNKRK